MLLATMLFELLTPVASYALTSGPSQPEMQSFEPVGTTDMVNAFSGDFVYNIPLLDVEGYPINIAYHSGVTMEQEASWVGAGWNINPGTINRGVRGIPDDFDGEQIEKTIKINPEVKKRFGLLISLEMGGFEIDKAIQKVAKSLNLKLGASVDMGLSVSNYTGVSASLGLGMSIGVKSDWMSAGINMGNTFTTDNGTDVDISAYGRVSNARSATAMTTAVTGSFGKGYNSREGLKYTSFGVNPSFSYNQSWDNSKSKGKDNRSYNVSAALRPEGVNNTIVPISMQNFVPVITNASFMESNFYQFKVGIEIPGTVYPSFGGNFGEDKISFNEDGTRRAYGFFNLQHATKDDITDFARDRDGNVNRDKQYLPSGSMSYDVYAVNGQGTAGNFRGFRNDIGTVFDPYINSDMEATSNMVEVGVGGIFEAGWDRTSSYTSSSSGPWNKYKKNFSDKSKASLHEPYYFKQAGELSETSPEFYDAINGTRPLSVKEIGELNGNHLSTLADDKIRAKRSNLLYFFTGKEASLKAVSLQSKIENYTAPGSMAHSTVNRVDAHRKAHHASEFTQLLPDGRRYIYGIPAMNNEQVEYVMTCEAPATNNGLVNMSNQGDPYPGSRPSLPIGQNLHMKTKTPAYAHSYLLSSILSADYSDLTGDGITDDDLGDYTKFNYSRKDASYRWRTPYQTGMARFDRGVNSDCHDDKATFVIGSKEIWMLHSVESKNNIAEFYTSPREDAKASNDGILSSSSAGVSYKLDSVRLFNKRERIKPDGSMEATAVPIKTVIFTYDYSLCPNLPNGTNNGGKLTLRAISIRFGNSDIGLLSPYRFSYEGLNPAYNEGAKDMWGNYKPAGSSLLPGIPNHEFPYVTQKTADANANAGAWNLTRIRLPSGGTIHVSYEADDYAYVQDRRAMEMFKVEGVGDSPDFEAGSSLYKDKRNPYLYVYFARKKDGNGVVDEWYNSMRQAYLNNDKLIQYNFKVKMSANGEKTPSCNVELEDYVKGYAAVDTIGVCTDDARYGYVKLAPKNVDKMPSLGSELSLNPVTLSAIFYAKYYNNKALYPSSEILSMNDRAALLKQLVSSFFELSSYFRSPLTKYLNDGRAKYVDLDASCIRLCSQGKKLGGGHRVKRIEFSDNWNKLSDAGQPVATYGSVYDYTLEEGGRYISSGVATYEPLFGGDENPFKEPIATDKIGQKKDFPVVIPTELIMEGPIGESMYPPADVGYRKVTVTSIHKSEGASSQTIAEHEFFTAKEFPIRTANTTLEKLEDKRNKTLDLSRNKKEAYRVGQSYSLFFNDMHGRSKEERILVARGDGLEPKLVSSKTYEYFTNADKTLNNKVPCLYFDTDNSMKQEDRVLGVETDIMLDSREKTETSRTTGFMANLNTFLIGVFAIPIPSGFPKLPKSYEKTFSSIVSTKIIQQYGILKSVETFDKGGRVKLSNRLFDANTGLPLVTSVNTEHNDHELQVKYPAYWAYRCMGAAYKNIGYEERLKNDATIVDDALYFTTDKPERFNIGDELLFTLKRGCSVAATDPEQTYRLWITGKDEEMPSLPQGTGPCDCPPTQFSSGYKADGVTPLVDGEQDLRYYYGYSLQGVINSNQHPTAYSHTWAGGTPPPWLITDNINAVDAVYFKTYINVTPNNINSLMLTLWGDGYDKKDNSDPYNYCTSETALYVNNYYQGIAPVLTKFHPPGLVLGVNSIIVRLCNANGYAAFSATFENCPSKKHMIKALPVKRGMTSSESPSKTFPNYGRIYNGDIKVIRSGRRNQLQETVQELAVLNKDGSFSYHHAQYPDASMSNILAISANTYTDEAAASETMVTPPVVYFNPFVTGRKGNYRVEKQYNVQIPRSYTGNVNTGKGVLNQVHTFWKTAASGEYYDRISPDGSTGRKWYANMWVKMYSPWGNDLEVQDAAGNIQSNIFGYNNTLPVATVKNASWNNALYEHFEDYVAMSPALNFYQNDLHKALGQAGSAIAIDKTVHHTGVSALRVNSFLAVDLPVKTSSSFGLPPGAQGTFHFRPGKTYLLSYWQQVNQNTASMTMFGNMSLHMSGTNILAYPKTPVIDGWMLYEREFTVPSHLNGAYAEVRFAQSVLDDIRIIPVEANMKSYVYHPTNRKLVASLDENHMASFFEYDAEGKLVRIKKETEKGILTLKESRGGLQHILNTTTGNGSINLKD